MTDVTLSDFNTIKATATPITLYISNLGDISQISVDLDFLVTHNSRAYVLYRCDNVQASGANRFSAQILPINGVNFEMIIYSYASGVYTNNTSDKVVETISKDLSLVDHFYVVVDVTGNVAGSSGVLGYATNLTNLMYYLFETEAGTQQASVTNVSDSNLVTANEAYISTLNGSILCSIVREGFIRSLNLQRNPKLNLVVFMDKALVDYVSIKNKLGDSILTRTELSAIFTDNPTFFDNTVLYENVNRAGLLQLIATKTTDVWESSGVRYQIFNGDVQVYDETTQGPVGSQLYYVVVVNGGAFANPVSSTNYQYVHSAVGVNPESFKSFFYNVSRFLTTEININTNETTYSEEAIEAIHETKVAVEVVKTQEVVTAVITAPALGNSINVDSPIITLLMDE